MSQPRPFTHNGKEYEVRIASDGYTFHVRTFLNGKPANGYTYSVDVLTQDDAHMSNAQVNPVEELIKIAKSDVTNGIWEKYVAAVNASAKK